MFGGVIREPKNLVYNLYLLSYSKIEQPKDKIWNKEANLTFFLISLKTIGKLDLLLELGCGGLGHVQAHLLLVPAVISNVGLFLLDIVPWHVLVCNSISLVLFQSIPLRCKNTWFFIVNLGGSTFDHLQYLVSGQYSLCPRELRHLHHLELPRSIIIRFSYLRS